LKLVEAKKKALTANIEKLKADVAKLEKDKASPPIIAKAVEAQHKAEAELKNLSAKNEQKGAAQVDKKMSVPAPSSKAFLSLDDKIDSIKKLLEESSLLN
jgi:cell division protein FtsB